MARWRLTAPHYLNVPGTEWEQKEVSPNTKRQVVKRYPVPLFLNPEDPADQNYREAGELIVCHEGKGQRRDITFIGEPTPDMEPLDEEAEAISAKLRPKWVHPIDNVDSSGAYSDVLVRQFEAAMDRVMKAQGGAVAIPAQPEIVAQLMAQVAELTAQVARMAAAAQEEPLGEVQPTPEEIAASEAESKAPARRVA